MGSTLVHTVPGISAACCPCRSANLITQRKSWPSPRPSCLPIGIITLRWRSARIPNVLHIYIQNLVPDWLRWCWKTSAGKPVINQLEFEDLLKTMCGMVICLVHVHGYSVEVRNDRADFLARLAITSPGVSSVSLDRFSVVIFGMFYLTWLAYAPFLHFQYENTGHWDVHSYRSRCLVPSLW